MEYTIHNYVLISVKLPVNTNHCVFVSLEWALRIYIGIGSFSKESAMLHCHVFKVSQTGQNKTLAREGYSAGCNSATSPQDATKNVTVTVSLRVSVFRAPTHITGVYLYILFCITVNSIIVLGFICD